MSTVSPSTAASIEHRIAIDSGVDPGLDCRLVGWDGNSRSQQRLQESQQNKYSERFHLEIPPLK
jgi:hypothetical protein